MWRTESMSLRRALRFAIAAVLATLAGCTSLPTIDRQANASLAIDLRVDTPLGAIARRSTPNDELSGFRLLTLGPYSLDARLELARRAQVSLDVQYYQFANDETGRWLLRALRDAAARGVRVRLLVDDLYTGGSDPLFLAFAAHDNVEVRLFNPFCCARQLGPIGRLLASLAEFGRLNHRMHNKLFVADGAVGVIGGRNVANAYFLRGGQDNFVDLDALTVGFVVPPLQFLFDRYWNSAAVYPLHAVKRSDQPPAQLRASFEAMTGPLTTPAPPPLSQYDVLGYGPIGPELDSGRLDLIWGDGRVFADHPDKPFDDEPGGALAETSVPHNLFETLRMARSDVVISSPYFVPGPVSLEMMRALRERGVRVIVLTNSLASTDEPIVHVGYSRYRETLLKMGVDLYELSAPRLKGSKRQLMFGQSLGRLHAKLAVIDGEQVFIGSMNLDPRSATINTEIGSITTSPTLARELRHIDRHRPPAECLPAAPERRWALLRVAGQRW